ncbi:hypothetical protein CLU83_1282 [Flavobacterium sp. 1]|uniref:hypothetical protein n=1 Tax=Flavobacterium sp. 1 TaxID=2035200 RepID=UPI000C2437B4|nr:hypothetical protein [Flavobacterium sp. 1]PJJ08052.1 hypothetical protein CLU83_1282 [Flavobacterium sp. 1]
MKKKIPLQILKALEPLLKENSSLFEIILQDEYIIKIIDKDKNSDFYFLIESFTTYPKFTLLVNRKPANDFTKSVNRGSVLADQIGNEFKKWLDILEGYEKVNSIFDDPIIEAFASEYYSEFEIIDEDAGIKPFNIKQILLLDEHLENIEINIERHLTATNKVELEEILNEVIELRENLTKRPKKWVIKKLSFVWAKISKQGPVFIKEFLSESSKLIIKESVKFIFNKGIDLLN